MSVTSSKFLIKRRCSGAGQGGRDGAPEHWIPPTGWVALAFGGLQVWWISSVFRRRDLARPLIEGECRKTLERIWRKEQRQR